MMKNLLPSYGAISIPSQEKNPGKDDDADAEELLSAGREESTAVSGDDLLVLTDPENDRSNIADMNSSNNTMLIKRHSSFTLSGAATGQQAGHSTTSSTFVGASTIPSEVSNMTKNLIGGGVLSLSGGIAMYANDPKAALSAVLWVSLLAVVFGYFNVIIAKSCALSRSLSYRQTWERTVGGERGGLMVAIVNTLDPLLGIYANAAILSQSLQLLLQGINVHWTVTACLLVTTLVGILPLCLMKNLNALAPFSALGMLAVTGALVAMIVRWTDGSYEENGQFYNDIAPELRPSFGTQSRPLSAQALPFVCMVYTSFDMHYNSPRFYAELRNASIPRFGQTTAYSFGITAILYFSIAVVGFLTFGENSNSYILNNYSKYDGLATFSRMAIGLCSLVAYALNFIGVRDNCIDIFGLAYKVNTAAKMNSLTLFLLSILTVTSCFITDLGLINSVGGGTTVTLVVFVFPALMFRDGIRKYGNGSRREGREVQMVLVLMVVGVVLGLIGVVDSILEAL